MGATWEASAVRKFLRQTIIGGAVGVASAALFLRLGKPLLPSADPSAMLTACVGLLFLVLGLFVGFGAVAPGTGAHFLNVEDAEELRDQRAMLGHCAISCILGGLFMILLGFSTAIKATGIGVTPLAVAGGTLLFGSIVFAKLCADNSDELARQISLEASVLSLYLGLLLFGGWAALAHLGLAVWIKPLSFLSGFALLQLLASFWVVGKRGMLKPR